MIPFLLVVAVIILLIREWRLRQRLAEMEERIGRLDSWQVAELTRRVWLLEHPPSPAATAGEGVAQATTVVSPTPEPLLVPGPMPEAAPAPLPEPELEPEPEPQASEPAAEPVPPGPTAGERLRARLGDEEWEALVGGSLLNKIGAVVLVVGISLFLAYSLANMGPAGRALTALATSGALLGLGAWLDHKQTYRVFSRGLVGAGWAGLYTTAYASYALPAAQVIDNEFAGALLLLAVAIAMVLHSLRYQVEAVTAIAYTAAFAALAVTPNTQFAVVALIPLAASLLYLAWRFEWHGMAVFGLAATYGACIAHGSSNAPLMPVETLFVCYWLLFEAFDLLRIGRRDRTRAAALIFPLNAAGFLGLSYIAWQSRVPERLWQMAAIASAMYLAASLTRLRIRPPSSFSPEETALERYRQGSYEAPLTLSAALAGLAIVGRVTGIWTAVGLAIEAEVLFLAGTAWDLRFLRWLGGAGFVFSLGRLWLQAVLWGGRSAVFGREVHDWTPPALLHAALFYLNRRLRPAAWAYSWLAAAMLVVVIGFEAPSRWIGAGWLALAVVLFEFGIWTRLREFRMQAGCAGALGVLALAATHEHSGGEWAWAPQCAGLVAVYIGSLRISRLREDRAGARERELLVWGGSAATLMLGMLLLHRLVPDGWLGFSWFVYSALLLELGLRRLPERLVMLSFPAAGVAAVMVAVTQGPVLARSAPVEVWASCLGAGVCAWLMAVRPLWGASAGIDEEDRLWLLRLAGPCGTMFVLAGIWAVAPEWTVPGAWAALAVVLLVLGRRPALTSLAWQSVASATLAFLHVWIANFPSVAMLSSLPAHLPAAGSTAAILYAGEFASSRASRTRGFFSALATVLVAGLLWKEISGSLLTVAWGVQGLALLAVGFPARERPLRLAGLALLLGCISKLFIYDLRHLETLYRILSFLALGVILLGVSWIYTRFRESIRRGLFER